MTVNRFELYFVKALKLSTALVMKVCFLNMNVAISLLIWFEDYLSDRTQPVVLSGFTSNTVFYWLAFLKAL